MRESIKENTEILRGDIISSNKIPNNFSSLIKYKLDSPSHLTDAISRYRKRGRDKNSLDHPGQGTARFDVEQK